MLDYKYGIPFRVLCLSKGRATPAAQVGVLPCLVVREECSLVSVDMLVCIN